MPQGTEQVQNIPNQLHQQRKPDVVQFIPQNGTELHYKLPVRTRSFPSCYVTGNLSVGATCHEYHIVVNTHLSAGVQFIGARLQSVGRYQFSIN